MRIKKTTQTTPVQAQIINTYSTSETDGYSCDYVNGILTDYVIETGTSGGWTYRKWNSGISECWKNIQGNTSVSNTWGSGLYYGVINAETFPTDLFISIPSIFYQNIGGTSLMVMNSASPSSTSTGGIQVARGTTVSSANYIISIKAIGKWK